MKKQEKIDVRNRIYTSLLKIKGMKETGHEIFDSKTMQIQTKLGPLNITPDVTCKSGVMSLFCRFLDTKKAKTKLNHWKQNLHQTQSPNFDIYAMYHIEDLLEIANS